MSLATRCTACGTVFRVVQDQLKVSEGWVRCGRCKDVFNALESLFDLDREAPPQWHPRDDPAPADVAQRDGDRSAPEITSSAATGLMAHAPALSYPSIADDPEPEFSAAATARLEREHPAARPLQPEPDEPFIEPAWAVSALPSHYSDEGVGGADAAPAPPTFLREAPRRAPQRPAAVAAWGAAAVLLLLLLVGQAANRFRAGIAAEWPSTRPLLARACGLFGCQIDAPRRIEDIAVESSTLTRADTSADGDTVRLAVVLRNRAAVALMMPTIDLSLTDISGTLVARRALTSEDFHVADNTLPPSAETTLQLLMSTKGRAVSGYTVEVFYP